MSGPPTGFDVREDLLDNSSCVVMVDELTWYITTILCWGIVDTSPVVMVNH